MNDELFAQRDIDAGLAEWLAPLLCLLAMERRFSLNFVGIDLRLAAVSKSNT